MVAAALFRLKDDFLARSLSRASQLIRMLTKGDGNISFDTPNLILPEHSQLPPSSPIEQSSSPSPSSPSPSSPSPSSPSPFSPTQSQSLPPLPLQLQNRIESNKNDKRRITWSSSSPLVGFDLQQRAKELQDLNSFSNLIIKLSLSSTDYIQKMVLPEFSVYLPEKDQDLRNVLGLKVFQNGLAVIFVSWPNQHEDEYNMNTLYGVEGELKLIDAVNTR